MHEGSFSAAGRKLHRAQCVVSQTLTNLEAQLGLKLFDRSVEDAQRGFRDVDCFQQLVRRVPSINFDKGKSAASIERMAELMMKYKAELWINRDKAQAALMKRPPAYYD
jgi:hypothetical protein